MGQWGIVVSGNPSTSGERRCENCCAVTYQDSGKGSWIGCGREGEGEKNWGKREKMPGLTCTTKI